MSQTTELGRVLWYELMTKDMAAAKAFYMAVVGWGITPFEGAGEPYDMWTTTSGTPVGGLMALPAGMDVPPHWAIYVGVPTLEDTVAHFERLGGGGVSPVIEVPTVGRFRAMRDPQGAVISLYEPASPPQRPEGEPQVGEFVWHELMTSDAEAAMSFYSQVFGWKPTSNFDMGAMGQYRMFGRAFPIGGMMNKPPNLAHVPAHWGIYIRVPDVHAAVERVKAGGGQLLNGPMEVPGGAWVANCLDPQGAAFSLHHAKPA